MRGFDAQDKRIIRDAEKYNKGIVIALNKWDIVPEKDSNVHKEFETYIYERIRTSNYIPVISISALKGTRIERVLDIAEMVIQERKKSISTPQMNDFVQKILKERPLPMKRGRQLKIQYALQVKSNPPVFKFFMNNPQELPPNYRRFIENKLREEFGFTGVPITMVFRQK